MHNCIGASSASSPPALPASSISTEAISGPCPRISPAGQFTLDGSSRPGEGLLIHLRLESPSRRALREPSRTRLSLTHAQDKRERTSVSLGHGLVWGGRYFPAGRVPRGARPRAPAIARPSAKRSPAPSAQRLCVSLSLVLLFLHWVCTCTSPRPRYTVAALSAAPRK